MPGGRRAFFEGFAARELAAAARARFVAVAELEVEALHDGTFARCGLRPSELERWRALQ